MGLESACLPVRGGRLPGGPQQGGWHQRAEADIDAGQPAGGADQRRGQFRHLVDDQVGPPPVQSAVEIIGSGREFEVREDLGEDEPALVITDQSVPAGEAGPHSARKSSPGPAGRASKPSWRARATTGGPVANATA